MAEVFESKKFSFPNSNPKANHIKFFFIVCWFIENNFHVCIFYDKALAVALSEHAWVFVTFIRSNVDKTCASPPIMFEVSPYGFLLWSSYNLYMSPFIERVHAHSWIIF